ncbi:MAG TPA: sulfotransferase domain-containing protein [Acidimicrobiia bacterium]|nr:sulfotransferase domain-containing protein [Acidimicrobiia bacterium]
MTLRNKIPRPWLRRLTSARHALRLPTGAWRSLPDFLIIGAQRAGTSSLYRYLAGHPDIVASSRKETEYFSGRYSQGLNWYRAHFPLRLHYWINPRMLTFEATPDYLLHPLAAERACLVVPHARIVVLLRDPVARAYSHFRHMRRLGFEQLDFPAALRAEDERIAGDLRRLESEPEYRPVNLLRFSYRLRGRYAEQLQRWWARYERERLLVLSSESFYRDTEKEFARVIQFLELRSWQPHRFENVSEPSSRVNNAPLDPIIAQELASYFDEPNRALFELIGADLDWQR